MVCAVSMNNLFGTGRIVPGLGFLAAASPAFVTQPLLAAGLVWNEHTRAFRLGDSVSEEEKGRRLTALIELQEEMSLARNRAMIGREFPVLVEGSARRGGGMLAGKTPQFKTAIFGGSGILAGDTVRVRVDSATGHSLMCSIS